LAWLSFVAGTRGVNNLLLYSLVAAQLAAMVIMDNKITACPIPAVRIIADFIFKVKNG
jgi:hypothetical protein